MNTLLQNNIDIAIINETWLKQNNNEIKAKPYQIIEKRREERVGGGMAILVHPRLIPMQIFTRQEDLIALKIKTENKKELLVLGVYIPPDFLTQERNKIYSEIEDIIQRYTDPEIVIAGDLNPKENKTHKKLEQLIKLYNLESTND